MNKRNAERRHTRGTRFQMPAIKWLSIIGFVPTVLIGLVLGGFTDPASRSHDVSNNVERQPGQGQASATSISAG